MHWEGCIGFHVPITSAARPACRLKQLLWRSKFAYQSIQRHCGWCARWAHPVVLRMLLSSPPAVSDTSSRITKIEIMGRKRKNRNRRATNSPMVPRNVAQSQTVGEYMPHADGK